MSARRAAGFAALLCLAHVLLWGGAFALAFPAPQLDGAEQLAWSWGMEWGYWKHPPLPTWVMHALVAVFGPSAAITYVSAQACVAIALFLLFVFGCEFMPPERSLAAAALTSLALFYNAGADAFNHDIALLPLIAALLLLVRRAMQAGRLVLWAAAGVVAGLALLTKYIIVLHFAALALAFAVERGAHTRRNALGIAIASLCTACIFAPHVAWLVANDFAPLRYAKALSEWLVGSRLSGFFGFIATVLARLLAVGFVAFVSLRGAPREEPRASARFLWIVGIAPLALTLAFGLVEGTAVPGRWAVQGLPLTGWLLLQAWPARIDTSRLLRLLAWTAGTQLAICLSVAVVAPMVAQARHMPRRSNFPAGALAQAAQATWAEHMSSPLRLVIGHSWTAGTLIGQLHRPLAVLVEAEPGRAPWIPQDAPQRCGALVLFNPDPHADHDPVIDAAITGWIARSRWRGQWNLPWPDGSPRATIDWGIVDAQPGATCPL